MNVDSQRSKISLKIRQILIVFADNNFPKDDTMVEKLNNWLQTWLSQTGRFKAFIQDTSLDTLMQEISKRQSLEPLTWAFFMKLAGYIPYEAQDSDMQESTLHLYKRVVSENCTDLCVLNAWLLGLDAMLQDCVFIKEWMLTEGIHKNIISCLWGHSLYVTKSAIEVLTTLMIIECRSSATECTPLSEDKNLRQMFCELWNNTKDDMDKKLICLQVLQRLMQKVSQHESGKLYTDYEIFAKIYAVLQICDSSHCAERNQAMALLTESRSCIKDNEVQRLENLVSLLLQSGSVQTAMALAQWLFFNCGEKLNDQLFIQEVQFFILHLTQQSDEHIFDNFDGQKTVIMDLLDKRKQLFPSLFLRQLELLVNYSKYKVLPVKETEVLLHVLETLCSGQCSENSLVTTLYKKQQKIYLAVIDAFSVIFKGEGDHYVPVMHSIILLFADYLKHTLSCVLIQKTLQVMLLCLEHINNTDATSLKEVWQRIDEMLQHLFCQTKWEILDSVTEFLTNLLLHITDVQVLGQLIDSSITRIIQLTDNSESYLRASAISCLGAMFTVPHPVWAAVTAGYSMDVLLDKIICATKDQEAFPRRAAVKVIRCAYDSKSVQSRLQEVFQLMSRMISDLDWEVKCSCLDFWKAYVESLPASDAGIQQEPDGSQQLNSTDQLQDMVDTGCAAAILKAVRDCDKTVQGKACQVISIIKRKYNTKCVDAYCKLADCGTGADNGENSNCNVLKQIWELDLAMVTKLSNQSTDQYEGNAEALLDDIITSTKGTSHTRDTGEQDNDIDCY